MVERHSAGQQLRADQLIERVVAAHVFPQREHLASRIEKHGGMEAARGFKDSLGGRSLPEALDQRGGKPNASRGNACSPWWPPPRATPCRKRRNWTSCRSDASAWQLRMTTAGARSTRTMFAPGLAPS